MKRRKLYNEYHWFQNKLTKFLQDQEQDNESDLAFSVGHCILDAIVEAIR